MGCTHWLVNRHDPRMLRAAVPQCGSAPNRTAAMILMWFLSAATARNVAALKLLPRPMPVAEP